MHLAASLQAVAHGSDSVLYFQLRQSRGASEKFHGAVIDHYGGSDTRVFKEVTEVGEALEQIKETAGSKTCAQAAVLYDRENSWALKDAQGPRNENMYYQECVLKQYRALREQGLNVDVISMEHDLSEYQVLAVPMAYLFRDGYEKVLRNYVKNGGSLVLSYWSGIVDTTDRCFLYGTPYGLMDVTGIRSAEIDALYDWEENEAVAEAGNHLGLKRAYSCNHLCELLEVSDAEVLMRYAKDFYEGKAVVTHKAYGSGHAYYVAADMEYPFYHDFYEKIVSEAGIKRPVEFVPEGIFVNTRETQKTEYLFVQNFGRKAAAVPVSEDYEVIYGDTSEVIEPLKTKVLKWKKSMRISEFIFE